MASAAPDPPSPGGPPSPEKGCPSFREDLAEVWLLYKDLTPEEGATLWLTRNQINDKKLLNLKGKIGDWNM